MLSNLDITGWLLTALYRVPGIIIGLSFHEWAHAYAAYKRGDPTARNLGRMTLNPMAHLDPIGIIALLLVGFGWARPVPVNTRNFTNPRKDEIIVSLAGVITNILIAFIATGLWLVCSVYVNNEIIITLIEYIVVINISLFIFNLIPVPPLDGFHVAECILSKHIGGKFFYNIQRYGHYILIAVLIINSRIGVLNYILQAILSGFIRIYMPLIGLLT